MSRSGDERVRLAHTISRLRACIDGLEVALRDEHVPIGLDASQAVAMTAVEVSAVVARLDAYTRAERDALAAARKGGE